MSEGPEPGDPNWKWFPSVTGDWQLDVITLLAVIGESSIEDHAQFISASAFGFLPRLIPAPQALLKPTRPSRLPETVAKMTGVYSGLMLDSVGFFANIVTPLDECPALGFKVVRIWHRDENEVGDVRNLPNGEREGIMTKMLRKTVRTAEEDAGGKKRALPSDEESGRRTAQSSSVQNYGTTRKPSKRKSSTRQLCQELLSNPAMVLNGSRPAIPAHLCSPLHILSALSFFLTIGIIIAAIFWQDGSAVVAVTVISTATSICGAASLWRPLLMKRNGGGQVPDGDVMIRTREGAFLLIKCTEDVARELYSGTEECDYYVGEKAYKLLMGIATIFIMFSVILLGNCTFNSQLFIGGTYIVLNGAYWCLGMLPRSSFWDLSRYEWEDITPEDACHADTTTNKDDMAEGSPSFTRTLWYAIRETKRTGWVELSGAAPGTERWKKWLKEAERSAKKGDRAWNAVGRKDEIMRLREGDEDDGALERAPAIEVYKPAGGTLTKRTTMD